VSWQMAGSNPAPRVGADLNRRPSPGQDWIPLRACYYRTELPSAGLMRVSASTPHLPADRIAQ
jgi:hypothetical protein